MSQTLTIKTPDAVSSTSRTFPKQGVFNLKITKNGEFDTVEIWFRTRTAGITLELEGASFQSTAENVAPRTIPPATTAISGTTLALKVGVTQYMKIKLNTGISVAHLRCSYAAKSLWSIVAGGNVSGQAFVDYSKKPYISTSLERMFATYPVRTDITKWDLSTVTSLNNMFLDNITFNQPIGNWDVSDVTTMGSMFQGASVFNQPIGNWDVSNVTSMTRMFEKATIFNQFIGNWKVSNVTSMSAMFKEAKTFNQPIGYWDVGSVTTMSSMFHSNGVFNQPIGNWDVSSVTSMNSMFYWSHSFNQPIGNWDISNVTNMYAMFNMDNGVFDQDLSSWAAKFNVDVALTSFFGSHAWGTTNYDKFLNALWTDINTTRPEAWALRTTPKILGMGSSKYSAASAAARDSLVSNGWTITDGGLSA